MSLLARRFREVVSKSKDYTLKAEKEFAVGYSTGFLSFDFLNGTVVHVQSPEANFQYYSIGITDGSMVMVIGRSGCGKTTLTIQMAANIIRPFKTSCIFHDDIEGGINDNRLENLTGFYGEELKERYIIRDTGITCETFYERIKMVYDIKMNNREEYIYDTGLLDTRGERVYKLEPTVFILDSLAMLTPDKYSKEDELSGQMATTATAKQNAMIFRRIIPLLKAANIILFVINHVNQKVELTPAQMTKNQVGYLKKGETLPGGNTPIYVSNLLLRVDNHTKLKETDALGIAGELVDVALIKSRTNSAGKSVTLVFDREKGFDQEMSLFIFMKLQNKINGSGAYLYLGDRDDMKFSQKKFKTLLHTSSEFRSVFMQEVMKALQEFTTDARKQEEYDESFDISSDIVSMMNSNMAS